MTLESTLPRNGPAPDSTALPDLPPSALGPLRPVADRWWLVLIVVLVALGGAVYAGLTRTPTYRAEAQLNVGRTDVRVQALPGYVAGAAALANAYSRVVASDEIVGRVAAELGTDRAAVAARLTAVPVPENPILRIVGKGDDPAAALELTRVATEQLERHVARTDASSEALDANLRQFRAQARRAAELRRRLDRLEGRRRADADGAPTAPSAEEGRLEVAYETARLRADSLAQMFGDRQAELASTAGIEVISRPALAGDDRRSVLQRLIAVGLVAGAVVGCALALLLGSRRRGP